MSATRFPRLEKPLLSGRSQELRAPDIKFIFYREGALNFIAIADGVDSAFWIVPTSDRAMKGTGPDRITLLDGWQRYLAKTFPGYSTGMEYLPPA